MTDEDEDSAQVDDEQPLNLVVIKSAPPELAANPAPQIDPRQGIVRDRASRLFAFLREFVQLRTKIIRSLDTYEEVLWLSDIPEESECFCLVWNPNVDTEEERPWIEVKKPKLTAPPRVPTILEDWVNKATINRSQRDEPEIYPQIAFPSPPPAEGDVDREDDRPRFVKLEDRPSVRTAWDNYVHEQWVPWAEIDRRKQQVKKIYGRLFHLHQQQAGLGESYEVVLGLGLLRWRLASGQEVLRHLIAAQASVEFDAARGVISVTAGGEGAKPQLEHDMLEPGERPRADIEEKFEQALREVGDEIWGNEAVESSLKSWIHSIGEGDGEYEDTLKKTGTASAVPIVQYAPALILRKRSDRGFFELYKNIFGRIEAGEEIPEGVVPLVDIEGAPVGKAADSASSGSSEVTTSDVDELYFPLPSNEEQRQIIHQLADNPGVLVQGPPGTGKSHTIANLVCHLLASGKRVLVTSQTARALRVLKDKVPAEVTDLSVILLGNDRASLGELEDSVNGITQKLNYWNPRQHERRLADWESRIREHRGELARTEARIRSLRESDVAEHDLEGRAYSGTAQQIAARLKAEEAKFGWISTVAIEAPDLADDCGISPIQAMALLRSHRDIPPARASEVALTVPPIRELTTPDEFESLVRDEASANARLQETTAALEYDQAQLRGNADAELEQYASAVHRVISEYADICAYSYPWVERMAQEVLADQDRFWRELFQVTRDRVEAVREHDSEAFDIQVSGNESYDFATIRDDAKVLLEHVDGGGKLKGLFGRPRVVKERQYIVDELKVGGRDCNDPRAIRHVWAWADIQCHLRALSQSWESVEDPPTDRPHQMLARYEDRCEPIEVGLALHDAVIQVKQFSRGIRGIAPAQWHDIESVRRLDVTLTHLAALRIKEAVGHQLTQLSYPLAAPLAKHKEHPLAVSMVAAINQRDAERYLRAYTGIEDIWKDRARLLEREEFSKLAEAKLPGLEPAILENLNDGAWFERLGAVDQAWEWHLADRWLAKRHDPKYGATLESERRRLTEELHKFIGQLAAEKAWGHCVARLQDNPGAQAYLKGWMEAVKKIGTGRSKRATKYQRVAREYLAQCRPSIPAWIMPLYRVVETIDPATDTFDVVIVDEASQSGLEALFLHYIGKQVIVVGDDQQIAPDYVGQNKDEVEALARRHLGGIPMSELYDLDNSFFSQANVRLHNRIRLREHFRCMPEIIQYSNKLCYGHEPLIPLRQYGADRLEPVVTAVHVHDGYVEGERNLVNPPEAEAIVKKIVELCELPEYEDKTMGVISLLGDHQARLIDQLLIDRLGPQEMERRRLSCGDAYEFQGDERNVIFLSMVSAPNKRMGTLSGERYKRRFNVAASRAQDQMWLFHSAGLQDLPHKGLRRTLLEYCRNPTVEQDAIEGLDISELRRLAASTGRRRGTQPAPFDSWFEIDVFLKLVARGYVVRPQYEVAEYRIDLVVEGMRGRIAVECDGDEWHGPEQYEADMGRQRQLERCGWTFWRVRGGNYYRDPDKALESLWQKLDDLGIYPDDGRPPEVAPVSRPVADSPRAEPPSPSIPQSVPTVGPAVPTTDSREPELLQEPQPPTAARRAPGAPPASSTVDSPPSPTATAVSGEHAYPDPRNASVDEIKESLTHVVEELGPMPRHYAIEIYRRRCGLGRASKPVRQQLSEALDALVRSEVLVEANEYNSANSDDQIVRATGSHQVNLRPRNGRNLNEIPPSEIASAMLEISKARGATDPIAKEELYRPVLDRFELKRLTEKAQTILDRAWTIYVILFLNDGSLGSDLLGQR